MSRVLPLAELESQVQERHIEAVTGVLFGQIAIDGAHDAMAAPTEGLAAPTAEETGPSAPETRTIEVVGSLGIAEKFLRRYPERLKEHKAWMGISTNKKTYPDDMVVDYARWAVDNTGGFTLLVSDWLHRFNLSLEHDDIMWWNPWDSNNKYFQALEHEADKRVYTLRDKLAAADIKAEVLPWSVMMDEMGYYRGEKTAFTAGYGHELIYHALDHQPGFSDDVEAIHKQLVPHLVQRAIEAGYNPSYVNAALRSYSTEEIFMTWLLAVTGEATIKIGPEWERLYDEVSAKYIGGKAYNRHGRSEAPFGAVYLRPKVYTAADYDELVANHVDHEMQTYMEQEQNFLTGIPDIAERTVVDIGAGHGRLVPTLAAAARNVVAVEIDGNMFTGLQETAKAYRNVEAIQGDALALPQLLKGKDVQKPVFVIAQNSLGTFEGNPQALLQTLSQLARQYDGEVVLSLLRQPALQKWGLHMYAHLAPMVGEADLDRTDPTKGQFVTKTGYRSKWWTDADIAQLISSGEVAAEQVTDKFHLLRIKY